MGKLILIRHGETSKNVAGSLHFANDSEGLNEKGRFQIKRAAEKILEFSPSELFSSKEKRAVESAQVISSILVSPFKLIDGMEERNWGEFAGKSWEEIRKTLDPMSLEERYVYIPPGGESWKNFETRLITAINGVVDKTKVVVVVTHGGAIRALIPHLLGVAKEQSFEYDPDNASLTVFDYDGKGFKSVVINDTSFFAEEN